MVCPTSYPQARRGQGRQRKREGIWGEGGGGIPHPLHSEEAFQKFLQAPTGTREVIGRNGWLVLATREAHSLQGRCDLGAEGWRPTGRQAGGLRNHSKNEHEEASQLKGNHTALGSPPHRGRWKGMGDGIEVNQPQLNPNLPQTPPIFTVAGSYSPLGGPVGLGSSGQPRGKQCGENTMSYNAWDSGPSK